MPDQDALLRAIDVAEENSYGDDTDGELSVHRALALDAYAGKNLEPAPEGRSQVTDWTLFETIQWVLPSLTRIFANGDNVVEFAPLGEDDIKSAEQESDYLNYLVTQKNNWFMTCLTWFQDALLTKNAYCMAFMEEKIATEVNRYEGQSEEAVTLLLQGDVELVGQREFPDPDDPGGFITETGEEVQPEMVEQVLAQGIQVIPRPPRSLFDVEIRQSKPSKKLQFKVLPPERVKVDGNTPDFTTEDSDYFEFFEHVSISELRSQGFDIDDDVASDPDTDSQEDEARDIYIDSETGNEHEDPAMRLVKARTVWIRHDYDEDGIAELQKVVVIGREVAKMQDGSEALWPASRIPVASIVPFLNTHRHMGNSFADLVFDIQRIKTAILRAGLDSLYRSQNPRHATSNKVDMKSLLTTRPGAPVRIKVDTPDVGGHVVPLPTEFVFPQSVAGLQHMDSVVESRVGVNRIFQGIDDGALNQHNRIGQLSTMAAQRVEQVARIFANGIQYLFSLAHELVIKSGHKKETVQLRGEWVDVDPSQWKTGRDMRVVVGFGAGNKDTLSARLMNMLQVMNGAKQAGSRTVTDQNLYEVELELTKSYDFTAPERFWTDPSQLPPPEPVPDPQLELVKIEGQKAQTAAQKVENDASEVEIDADLKKYEIDQKNELDKYKADLQAETQIILAKLNADKTVNVEQLKGELRNAPVRLENENIKQTGQAVGDLKAKLDESVQDISEAVGELQATLDAPKELVRDESGNVTAIKRNGKVTPIKRDKTGAITGT